MSKKWVNYFQGKEKIHQRRYSEVLMRSECELHDLRGKSLSYICITCFKDMSTKNKMPARSIMNGLMVKPLPTELNDITTLENTLIARDIPFMKIQLVPKSKIEKMVD